MQKKGKLKYDAKITGTIANTVFLTAPNGVTRIVRIKASGDEPSHASTVVDGGLEGKQL